MATKNIHPIHKKVLSKTEKEKLLNQRGITIWFTGLSGSGKSTIANLLERKLSKDGKVCTLLDGDNIRNSINSDLGFTTEERKENIRRIAEINKLFNNAGIISISSFISPTKEIRDMAMNIIGNEQFIEIYVSTSLMVCEKRDVKGLYHKARKGEIQNFTGIDALYEPPINPSYTIDTVDLSPTQSLDVIYQGIYRLTSLNDE